MRIVTPEEIDEKLRTHAHRDTLTELGGALGWRFERSDVWHADQEARQIVEFCLMLGQPVSDILLTGLFHSLVKEVADLQTMIQRMHT